MIEFTFAGNGPYWDVVCVDGASGSTTTSNQNLPSLPGPAVACA
jgi:hypothetical protein